MSHPVSPESRPEWHSRTRSWWVVVGLTLGAFFAQVPGTLFGGLRHELTWEAVVRVGIAVASALLLLLANRMPGPMIVAISALVVANGLLGANGSSPDLSDTFRSHPSWGGTDLWDGTDFGNWSARSPAPLLAFGFGVALAVANGAAVWAISAAVPAWLIGVLTAVARGGSTSPTVVAGGAFGLGVAFAVGTAIRRRRIMRAARAADQARRRESAEERERVRIAREIHDVVGHALSQINVQSGVGLHLFDNNPEQARSALASIKDASKHALDEVRSILGVLREGPSAPLVPQAGFADIAALVETVRSPQLHTELRDELGGAQPTPATQFAAYRIVQEALTNVVRHAHARHAIVSLERTGDTLVACIDDDGIGLTAPPGTGVLGMRERAALLGGAVAFDRSPMGGTRVRAILPWKDST